MSQLHVQRPVNNLLPSITQSQCIGNTVNTLKTSSQSDYFTHLNDEVVQQELIQRNIINDVNVIIHCENNNNKENIEFDDMQKRILQTFIRKWMIIIRLMDTYQEMFTSIFEKQFIKHKLRLQRQQQRVRITKPSKSSLARAAREFGIENIKIYLKDDNFNWDKFRKYKIIGIKGAILKCIHNNFNIASFEINDPQTKEPITFSLKKKKELYSETGIMIIAKWCDKVLALPRFQSFNAPGDVEKLAFLWDEGWTDELMEIIISNIKIPNYPLFVPNYRILNKDKLRNILKNNNLEKVVPRSGRSNKQQEFEEHLLMLQQQITDHKNAHETAEREYNQLRQEFDEYKVNVISKQHQMHMKHHQMNVKIQTLQQQIDNYNCEQTNVNAELDELYLDRQQLRDSSHDKDREIMTLKTQIEEYELILQANERLSSNEQQKKILRMEYQINKMHDINTHEMNQKKKEIVALKKRLQSEIAKNKQLGWAVENRDSKLLSLHDSNIKQSFHNKQHLIFTPESKSIPNKLQFKSTIFNNGKRSNHTRDLYIDNND